ncbi:MAG TPA: anti-sigma factor [Candidatus Acidoferrales bacterium]|nr:anti-sigma factor [Candidatus Acidoferrales bacterium]
MLKGRRMRALQPEERARKANGASIWLWAGLAALLILSVYSGWQAKRLRRELAQLRLQSVATTEQRARLEKERANAQRTALILADPASVQVAMPHSERNGAPPMRAYWHAQLGIVVAGVKIPAPAGDRTLELWLLPRAQGGKPIPAGFARPQPDGTFVLLVSAPPASRGDTKALTITEEPAGGSPQPTTTPRWVGAVN